jgi:hypothetical protein
MTIEREWFVPCIALTAGAALFALFNVARPIDLLPAMGILPAWMAAIFIIASVAGLVRMGVRGEARPMATARAFAVRERKALAAAALVLFLAGLNMVAFMWIKPLLNVMVPFTADPLLADLDRALFFGKEPWTAFQWLNFPAAGLLYHPGWFFSVMVGLMVTVAARPSPERSAVLLSYFVLWTLVAPLVHTALPAAGPIFYERLGLGDRFSALPLYGETRAVRDYLWSFYASGSFGAGNGISAMPSMHVTTSSWVVVAIWVSARAWLPLAVAAWATIFSMSVALGWHYALDGIVGAIAALCCFMILRAVVRLRHGRQSGALQPAG